VTGIAATMATAGVMFAATNLDDAVVLTVLNAASRATGAPKQWQIWVGQYIGVGLMIVVALLGALGLRFVPLHWVGLLGLIPFTRGILALIAGIRAHYVGDPEPPASAAGLWSVIGVTFANGGDNIAVYAAAFRVMGSAETALTVAVFAAGIAVWCQLSVLLVSHQRLVDPLRRSTRWIIPAVFIALGVYILARSGLLAQIG
jgi:cadmium resistance protein CadD (predicted permease)